MSLLNTFSGDFLRPAMNPEFAKLINVCLPANISYAKGTILGQVAGSGTAVAEVQSLAITGTPTGGTFRLAFAGQITSTIAYNASAAAVQAALEALSTIGSGGVVCSGGALPGTAVTITFAGNLAGISQPLITVASDSLTGGTTPATAVTQTTDGKPAYGFFAAYDDSLSNGLEVARLVLQYATTTDSAGKHTWGGGEKGDTKPFVPAYYCGDFFGSDLVGLDANGVTDMRIKFLTGLIGTITDARTIVHIP